MSNTKSGGVQSVRRALRMLDELALSGDLGVTELASRLGVHKATASRLLATLADGGVVRRDPETERYRLGYGLLHLAGSISSGLDLVREARPSLEQLAGATGEAVNLAVLDEDSVVHIDQIAGTSTVVSVSWIGRRLPLHCTANGKVLLAFLDEAERERLLKPQLEAHTPNTIIDLKRLRRELRSVVSRGWARATGELEEGLNAVAAPVRGADGRVVAAVSVSGPEFRMRPSHLNRMSRPTVKAAESISRRLGLADARSQHADH